MSFEVWGEQEKHRSKSRREYFREYNKKRSTFKYTIGYLGEELALKVLKGSIRDNKTSHDLLWNGKTIEVKAASLIGWFDKKRGKKYQYFRFNIKRQAGLADYFLFLCIKNRDILMMYLVPGNKLKGLQTAAIGRRGSIRFSQYKISKR